MTGDYVTILQGLVSQYGPHCFRAHVSGQGYVNDGSNPDTREDFDREYRRAAVSEIENLRYAPGYAEPGHQQPAAGVLLGNWNNLPSQAERALETAGYAIEWEDEWIECDDCRRTFRTCADSYCWRPAGQVFEHDRECLSLCLDCLQEWAQQQRSYELEDDEYPIGTRVNVRTSLPGEARTYEPGQVTAIATSDRRGTVYTVLADSGNIWHVSIFALEDDDRTVAE